MYVWEFVCDYSHACGCCGVGREKEIETARVLFCGNYVSKNEKGEKTILSNSAR